MMPDVKQPDNSQQQSGEGRHHNDTLLRSFALGGVIAVAGIANYVGRNHGDLSSPSWSISLKQPPGRPASWTEPVPMSDLISNEQQASAMRTLPSEALSTPQGISPLIQRSISDLKEAIRKEVTYRAQAERTGLTGHGPEKDASDSRHEKARLLLNASAKLLMLQHSETPVEDKEWRMGTAAFNQALELYTQAAQLQWRNR